MPDRSRFDKPDLPRTRASSALPLVLAAALTTSLLAGELAGQAPPPNARWHTFRTPHFQVVYHEGLEEVARRAAERGERTLEKLNGFGDLPPLPIQLVVTDHADLSNGFAQPAPYPRVTIWTRPPLDGPQPIPFDDWLEVLMTHELIHILHLEMTGRLGRFGRALFGRPPTAWPFVPSLALPRWSLEGVAVHGESALTDGGRGHGARQRGTVRAAALNGEVERLDQVLGDSPAWPGGDRPYLYGGLFHEWLAEKHGEEAVGEYFAVVARRLNPYRIDASSREVFGRSLQELHQEWREEAEEEARALRSTIRARGVASEPALLTRDGRFALHAVFHPRDGRMAFARADGRSEAGLFLAQGAQGVEGARRLLPLHHTAPPSWGPDGSLWIPQLEFVDRYHIRGELWRVDEEGRRARITRGGRIVAVDVHPDGDRLVAVQDVAGSNRLVLLTPAGQVAEILAPEDPGIHWAHPRWSPDGNRLAAVRWRAGGSWALVLLAPDGREVQVVEEGRAPLTGPAWAPEGDVLLWSSERTGVRNLYAAEAEAGEQGFGAPRQVTDVETGAAFPAVSPDGSTVVFSLLTASGWDLARIPFDPSGWFDPLPEDPRVTDPGSGTMEEGHQAAWPGEPAAWSPASTLRPRYWLPHWVEREELAGVRVLPQAVGIATGAGDAVGRNRWSGFLLGPVGDPGRRWEGGGSWSWAGLGNPVITAAGEQRWEALGVLRVEDEGGATRELFAVARERSLGLSAGALRPGFRRAASASLGARVILQNRFLLERDGRESEDVRFARPDRDVGEVSLLLAASSVRGYPLSVSPQEGAGLTVRLRGRRDLSVPDTLRGVRGGDAAFQDVVAVGRAFLPLPTSGFAPAVLGFRGSAGAGTGPGAGSFHFNVGGSLFPVRGFPSGSAGGDRAWSGTAELRIPLRLIHRGWGVAPLHLDRLSGSLFLDGAGARWTPAPAGGTTWLASAGGELALHHTFLSRIPTLVRVGWAVPLRGGEGVRSHGGLGWAF